jgi:hypothetical protein
VVEVVLAAVGLEKSIAAIASFAVLALATALSAVD